MDLYESQQIELLRILGKQIGLLRTKLGISPEQLGQKVGLTEQDIKLLEDGKRILDLDLIEKVAKELGVTLEDLFDAARKS